LIGDNPTIGTIYVVIGCRDGRCGTCNDHCSSYCTEVSVGLWTCLLTDGP